MIEPVGEPPLLEFERVSVVRGAQALLSNISFQVTRGSLHAIVGSNGAGKTTLLTALLGQTPFEGRIVANWRGDGQVGYVPQTFRVDESLPLTVEEFLALTRQRRPVCLGIAADSRRRIAILLQQVGLSGMQRRALAVLSGGETRRLLLAHATDPIPELLVLDEPATGLDESGVARLEELLHGLRQRGSTVMMVTHDLAQVRRLADRVTVLDRRVVTDGPVAETLAREDVRSLVPAGRSPAA